MATVARLGAAALWPEIQADGVESRGAASFSQRQPAGGRRRVYTFAAGDHGDAVTLEELEELGADPGGHPVKASDDHRGNVAGRHQLAESSRIFDDELGQLAAVGVSDDSHALGFRAVPPPDHRREEFRRVLFENYQSLEQISEEQRLRESEELVRQQIVDRVRAHAAKLLEERGHDISGLVARR